MRRFFKGPSFGAMLLIAGSCIGAGMLALPIVTGLSGFFPSLLLLAIAWSFMTLTGLLLLEANSWFSYRVNLLSIVEHLLGKRARFLAWGCYLLLFYSLLVAYLAGSGSIFSGVLTSLFGISCPIYLSTLMFGLGFGWVIYLGTRPADLLNRIFMGGLIICYLAMIGFGMFHVKPEYLLRVSTQQMLSSLSILVVSFGFQNMIPSIYEYVEENVKRTRTIILGGSLIALGVYAVWQFFVLGVVPLEGDYGILESFYRKEDATIPLRHLLHSEGISYFAQGFALFAIVTSFIAQGLALVHFIADGIHWTHTPRHLRILTCLVIFPPLFFALYDPKLFFAALSFAGGFCAVILFGVLPAWGVWVGRYRKKLASHYRVFGGKALLCSVILFSLIIFISEFFRIVKG